jgi:hypothetical protein
MKSKIEGGRMPVILEYLNKLSANKASLTDLVIDNKYNYRVLQMPPYR